MLEDAHLQDIPLLVLANKQDLALAKSPNDIATALRLCDIRDREWFINGISAKNGTGLNEAFQWLARKLNAKRK